MTQVRTNHGRGARIIRVLYKITVALAALGGGLFLASFLLLPILGYAAATTSAGGLWFLLAGAVTGFIVLAAAVINRVMNGSWFLGRLPERVFSTRGWVFLSIAAIVVALVLIALDYVW
jgi:hypothetical protein